MSKISLLVIRIEIEDSVESPILSLTYTASSTAIESVGKGQFVDVNLSASHLKELQGAREFKTLYVETYITLKEGMSEDADKSIAATGCVCKDDHTLRMGSSSTNSKESSLASIPSSLEFTSGNPAVEKIEGIIHFFKENNLRSTNDDLGRSEMLCILAVPSAMTSQDLLKFLAPVEETIQQVKIIKDGTPNRYTVLIKFKTQAGADCFYQSFNNVNFNSFESHSCHLAYVARVESTKTSQGGSHAIAGMTELPMCPVCLERMDESVDGVLTVLCDHSFHSACLAQWGDTSCPVCRYVQTPDAVEDNQCFQCDSREDLWICLVCGKVGCGRYVQGHANIHFQESHHCYAMQLGSNRVWDYAGDNFVHRLIQNKGDGKLVEVQDNNESFHDEKLDSITLEYTYLLTSQLESQKLYFEGKIETVEKSAMKQRQELEGQSKSIVEKCQRLEQKVVVLSKEKKMLDSKLSVITPKLGKLSKELEEEQEMNKSLSQNQAEWQKKLDDSKAMLLEKEEIIKDLSDQLRDVMFSLDAQDKLSRSLDVTQDELDGSNIIVPQAPNAAEGKHKRRAKRK